MLKNMEIEIRFFLRIMKIMLGNIEIGIRFFLRIIKIMLEIWKL